MRKKLKKNQFVEKKFDTREMIPVFQIDLRLGHRLGVEIILQREK